MSVSHGLDGLCASMHKCACWHVQPVSGLRGAEEEEDEWVEEEEEEEEEEASGKGFNSS